MFLNTQDTVALVLSWCYYIFLFSIGNVYSDISLHTYYKSTIPRNILSIHGKQSHNAHKFICLNLFLHELKCFGYDPIRLETILQQHYIFLIPNHKLVLYVNILFLIDTPLVKWHPVTGITYWSVEISLWWWGGTYRTKTPNYSFKARKFSQCPQLTFCGTFHSSQKQWYPWCTITGLAIP